ncbi:hydrogen peroxide-dependent heme synthase [Protaetiibacter mangrovi]|uniref:Coproheme decarboxylase n=1 Tax=Protaetiibacter mangrovi TaxID=2970926 RepID=A0ABT1ZCD7_9MICO|nr:hydrogen peroxide-dependent heme synthase [Protaetiibacter mangrovi]MCS0498370.1 chlorite dismutase family protein [Protaetiibacter mangrovi]
MTSATPVPSDSSTDNPSGFALWAVWRRDPATRGPVDTAGLADAVASVEAAGVVVRGLYDVSGLRADADLMVWLTGDTAEGLQGALRTLRRVPALASLLPTWNVLGVHREAEFSRAHAPSFLRGLPPKGWVTVYPFVRSYDWYLLPEEERRAMLADHGRKGSEYPSVQANTVAAFALGDYEWILALEADEVTELVDLMRHLRKTEARMHIREEVPFFTGRRITVDEVAEVLA